MQKKRRVEALDYIRVLATFLIFLFHWNIFFAIEDIQTDNLFVMWFANGNIAYTAVSLFFVLSGASLLYSNGNPEQPQDFSFHPLSYAKKRFLSIYPSYYIAYLMAFLFTFGIQHYAFATEPKYLLFSLIGFDGYLNYMFPTLNFVGEWFVGCIVLIYLCFPLLLYGVKKHPIITGIVAVLLFPLYLKFYFLPGPVAHCFLTRIPEVLFGMYFAQYFLLKRNKWWEGWGKWLVAGIALILHCIILFVPMDIPEPIENIWLGIPAFLVLYVLTDFLAPKIGKAGKIITFLSGISFEFFLLHHTFMDDFIHKMIKGATSLSLKHNLFLFAIYLILVLAMATGVHYLVRILTKILPARLHKDS